MSKEVAILAGGCFWCTEAIFKRIRGVSLVTSGYAGGLSVDPSYEEVSTGETGHAEAIRIEFDPGVISFEKILEIFWNTHDPTTQDQQGNDVGSQYRSVIFYLDDAQKKIALNLKEKLTDLGVYKKPIVTQIVPFKNFFEAEGYHKNYYDQNTHAPYCTIVIDPKIKKLMKSYGEEIKDEYK